MTTMNRGVRARDLPIAGLTPLSLCDWPGRLVATVFVQGCPWRCTYCHNATILDLRAPGAVPWQQVLDLLARRQGRLDGVVFSGGEATSQPALAAAMRAVRAEGFAVGLHTAGAYPRRLPELLPWVDWVGLDIKAPRGKYARITGVQASADKAFDSLQILLDAGVDLQVRTTMDPTVLTAHDAALLIGQLRALGVTEHELQQVRDTGTSAAYQQALARAPDAAMLYQQARVQSSRTRAGAVQVSPVDRRG